MEILIVIIGGLWLLLLAMGGYIVAKISGEMDKTRVRLHRIESRLIWLRDYVNEARRKLNLAETYFDRDGD